MLGLRPSSDRGRALHPSSEQIFRLWRIYLENIHPLTKIVHQPTLQDMILDASSNLDEIPKNLEALMFAIYSTAVMSLQEDECQRLFREPQTSLLERYRFATRKALVRAKFLETSEIMVLQAFVLHLVSSPADLSQHRFNLLLPSVV